MNVERALAEFMRAWEAGEDPDPETFLDGVAEAERHALSEQIRTYLMVAPEPAYDAATWERLAADPAAVRAGAMPLAEPEPWPSLLPRLRAQAGLTWADVAGRLGVSRPARAAGYLEAMERGDHDPLRVTRRALDALGRILGVPADTLGWTGGPPAPMLARAAAPMAAGGAAAERVSQLDLVADLGLTEASEWDDSDDLFLGGRSA